MSRFLLRRLLFMLLTMFVVSLIVFVISEVVPLDVARNILGPYASADSIEHLRKQMGLDLPVMTRYVHWLGRLLQGDLGDLDELPGAGRLAALAARRQLRDPGRRGLRA